MSVESWDPGAANTRVTADDLARLLQAAQALDEPDFGLAELEVARLAALARHPDVDWVEPAADLGDAELLALVRLFTKAEAAFPSWQAGAKSPVIVLAAELRRRGSYPAELTAWIKANTDNRFLPYGNLMDRL